MMPVSLDSQRAVFNVYNDFIKHILVTKHLSTISAYLESYLGFSVDIVIISQEEEERKLKLAEESDDDSILEDIDDGTNFSAFTFENFIIGNSNKFVHAACVSVTNGTGDGFNPLFIYGESGLGKTHLLYAIKTALMRKNSRAKVKYIKGEEFTNELIENIRLGSSAMQQFREKYRFLDCLLIDDIQFIAGKESTQEEFFHTFNTLFESKKQIVLTSDKPPKDMRTLDDRLRTRFEWGLTAKVETPDLETRMAIIKKKSENMDLDIPNDINEYIAFRLKRNVRQIEGAIKKFKALTMLEGRPVNIDTAKDAIKDVMTDNLPVEVIYNRIINETSKIYNISIMDMKSHKRDGPITNARQVAMYLIRENCDVQLKKIGEIFEKDHTTVMHACKKVEAELEKKPELKAEFDEILKNTRH